MKIQALAKKLKSYAHQKELQAQIKDKQAEAKNVSMSEVERQINRELLKHVQGELKKAQAEVAQ